MHEPICQQPPGDRDLVHVSRATVHDAPLLAELGARTFRDTYAADNTAADMESYLATWFSPELQTGELADERTVFLIARVAGEAAGYARLRFGDAPDCVQGVRPVEIVRFYADLPWIGRGVGKALMTSVFEVAADEGCDVVWLDVWEKNPRAMAFYAKWGFDQVGSQSFILGDDVQDDVLMAKAVDNAKTTGGGGREVAQHAGETTEIRPERPGDIDTIREVTRLAFTGHPYSQGTEPLIIDALREAGALELSLVAVSGGSVVGHIAFSPAAIGDVASGWFVVGPFAVHPELQGRGLGRALLERGLDVMRSQGAGGCALVGDPGLYGRFGFRQCSRTIWPGVPGEYVLCLPLKGEEPEGAIAYHAAFEVRA